MIPNFMLIALSLKLLWFQVNDPMFHSHCPKFQVTLVSSLMGPILILMVGVSYLLVHHLKDFQSCKLMIFGFTLMILCFVFIALSFKLL